MPLTPGSPSLRSRRISSLRKYLALPQESNCCILSQGPELLELEYSGLETTNAIRPFVNPINAVTVLWLHRISKIPTTGMGIKFRVGYERVILFGDDVSENRSVK